jgi:hypothetical protein
LAQAARRDADRTRGVGGDPEPDCHAGAGVGA